MARTTVTQRAVRELVNEVLDNKDLATTTMSPFALTTQINPVVSPSAPYDAPLNPNFTPQDKPEFVVAMQRAVKGMDDSSIPKLYAAIIDALEEFGIDPATRIPKEIEDQEEEKRQAALGANKKDQNMKPRKDTKEEALVRAAVKRVLKEAGWSGLSTVGLGAASGYADVDKDDPEYAERPKSEDEKNVMGQVSAGEMAKALGIGAGSTYVKGEQQLLNKYLTGLLDPDSRKMVEEYKRASFIKFMIGEFINELVSLYADADPEVDDPQHMSLLMNYNKPDFQFKIFESEGFSDWYDDSIKSALSEGGDDQFAEMIKDLGLKDSKSLKMMGKGFGRLDQTAVDYKRLATLYHTKFGTGEAPEEITKGPGPTGGRKGLAARATGKKSPPKRRT